MSSLEWIDSTGAASLSNTRLGPAANFFNWNPDVDPIGAQAVRLSNARIIQSSYRDDDLVSFEIRNGRKITRAVNSVCLPAHAMNSPFPASWRSR
jgi:hypothetical protein